MLDHHAALSDGRPADRHPTHPGGPSHGTFNLAQLDGGTFPHHQATGIAWLLDHPQSVLADDVGLGKTIQALGLHAALAARGDLSRAAGRVATLVTTDNALTAQWAAEAARFLPGLVVATSADKGVKTLARFDHYYPDGVDLLVVGHRFASARTDQLAGYAPRLVIVDEASGLKGGGKDFDAVRTLTGLPSVARAVAMTATPVEVCPVELWRTLAAVHAPCPWTEQEFRDQVVTWKPGYTLRTGEMVPPVSTGYTPDGLRRLRSHLPTVVLRRTTDQVGLPLPERVGEPVVWVTLDPASQAAYLMAERMTGRPAVQRMEQAARRPLAHAVVAWLARRPDVSKAVAYAENLERLDVLAELLTADDVPFARIDGKRTDAERSDALTRFRDDPACRVLLGSRVLERGLNLQHASVLLSLDSSWNPAREAQRMGRIRRIGSPHTHIEGVTFLGDTPKARRKTQQLDARRSMATEVGL